MERSMGESSSKNLSKYLLENFEVKLNKKDNIVVEDFTLAGNGLATRFYNRIFKGNRQALELIDKKWLYLDDGEIKKEITSVLPSTLEEIKDYFRDIEFTKVKEELGLEITKEFLARLIPVVDLEDVKGTSVMIDKSNYRATTIEEKSWEKLVGGKQVTITRELGYNGFFHYNPRSLEPFITVKASFGDVKKFNKYSPPEAKINRDVEAKLDPLFIEYMEGFFKDSCKSYAYNWLYYSFFQKMPTYMVLVGVGGIGKNLIAEALKTLHGSDNFKKAPPSALSSKFNGHLENCTMLFYDEAKFSLGADKGHAKNRLKEWANDYVPIENKGRDAKGVDIFCSSIIATNNDSDVHLEQLDRKFSVMELSEERLEKRIGVENTRKLWEIITRPDFPHGWLNWLETKIDPDFNPHVEYRGPKFKSLVISSLTTWQTAIRDAILTGEQSRVYLASLKEDISTIPTSVKKIEDFLNNYLEDGKSLGKLKIVEGKKFIEINADFLKDEYKDLPEGDDLV